MNGEEFLEYVPRIHELHADPVTELYYKAHDEFAWPMPSTPLKRFYKLNTMTGGLRPKEFTILCGATGTGKTTLCANLSVDLAEQGIPQFVASVETGQTDYVKRMISAMAGHDWNTGDAINTDMLKVFHETQGRKLRDAPFWLSRYEDRTTVDRLMADIGMAVRDHGVKVAFIDNLNFFMEVTSDKNAVVEMDRVIHSLIIFCKKIPVHVVMVMHPKKTEHGRVESEFDIKGSSTAVQEAHNILLFNRIHPELVKAGTAKEGDREIMIAKMRRKGKYVRRRLVIEAQNGVLYKEGEVV